MNHASRLLVHRSCPALRDLISPLISIFEWHHGQVTDLLSVSQQPTLPQPHLKKTPALQWGHPGYVSLILNDPDISPLSYPSFLANSSFTGKAQSATQIPFSISSQRMPNPFSFRVHRAIMTTTLDKLLMSTSLHDVRTFQASHVIS